MFRLVIFQEHLPMSSAGLQESTLDPQAATYRATVQAGEPLVHEVRQGQTLRIVDLCGNQAVDTLFYNAHDYADRYSAQDTMRSQASIYLTTGTKLMSTGRHHLLTIVADTCGRHDTLGGACSKESNQTRYALDKRSMHACREVFLKGARDWSLATGKELNKRDLAANINFFMNVPVTPEGELTFADGISEAGKYVELRAEMDVLLVISNCPQLNNPCNAYNPTPVEVLVWDEPSRA